MLHNWIANPGVTPAQIIIVAGEKSSTPAAASAATPAPAPAATSTTPADASSGEAQKYGFLVQKVKKGLGHSCVCIVTLFFVIIVFFFLRPWAKTAQRQN